ncbi:hypothetical protein E5K00_20025 [Hymenobacter aquaticus]|uniref:Secretin/TonB short N-terminal domain-containing protein n=1 Tax=Hymenobacter aquaticus TaxID=1867101 RepID=A0A4Z0PRE1_9BACT|nr:STN domain-containing protein [Hymenobacter aquaticus]TGE20297.1 hypothetical protein E5K00_20025 [Hymenobacter aquaticus]
MRYLSGLVVCLWLLSGGSWAQSAAGLLARRVSVAATEAPLQQVLRDITRQSGIPFSYSSTFIPLQKRVTLHTNGPRPVGDVLQRLFQGRGVSYQVIGGQIVLWRTGERPPFAPPKTPKPATEAAPAAAAAAEVVALKKARPGGPGHAAAATGSAAGTAKRPALAGYKTRPLNPAGTVTASTQKSVAPKLAPAAVPAAAPVLPRRLPTLADTIRQFSATTDTTTRAAQSVLARWRQKARRAARAATGAVAHTARRTGQVVGKGAELLAGETNALLDTLTAATAELKQPLRQGIGRLAPGARRDTLAGRVVAVHSGLPGRDTVLAPVSVAPASLRKDKEYTRHRAQVSFITPLGSNGLRSGRSINDLSLNVLAGYSAGVRGAEVGGLVNVVRDTVRGVQVAGLLNVTGTEVQGLQAAGLVNITGGSVGGGQAAGLVNMVRDDARGLQVAGLVNMVGGAARTRRGGSRPALARQLLGLPRLLATDSVAGHPAAPSATSLPGPLLQAAGVANLTGTDIRGLQTAAVLNSARRVTGLQFGLINVAKHVKGVQLGLINVADSVDGATLGIINVVRHGYLHGEVWTSETLPLNAALKLGVTRYYTILAAATQPFGNRIRWATGFGVGTASRQHGRFSWNLDVLGWYLLKQPGTEGTLLSYNQLRPSLVWQIEPGGHLGLVFSPTLNLALYENDGNGTNSDFGKNQLLLTDTQWGGTPVRLWLGGQIGLRF